MVLWGNGGDERMHANLKEYIDFVSSLGFEG